MEIRSGIEKISSNKTQTLLNMSKKSTFVICGNGVLVEGLS